MGSRVGDPEHCQSATRLQQGAPPCWPGSCPLRCWQHSARTEVEHQLEAMIASPHKDAGRMPLQPTRQQRLLRGSMRRERPARSARTALRPLPLPRRGRKRRGFRQAHCHDPEMNAEAEGGKLSSQIKTDEYTAWTCLPKILHDQLQQIAHVSVTSSAFVAACSSLHSCGPSARTPTPRCLDARHGARGVGGPITAQS